MIQHELNHSAGFNYVKFIFKNYRLSKGPNKKRSKYVKNTNKFNKYINLAYSSSNRGKMKSLEIM